MPGRTRASVTRFLGSCVVLIAATGASAAERHWVGPTGGLWSETNNWSETEGGPGGAGVPQPGDEAIARNGIFAHFDYVYTESGMGPNLQRQVRIEQDVPTSVMLAPGITLPGPLLAQGSGIGTYNQSAGRAAWDGFVQLGQASLESSNIRGYYTLSGNATLSIGTLLVHHGLYTQTGGHCTILGYASLGNGFVAKPGGIDMSGGTLDIAVGITQGTGASTFSGGRTTIGGNLSMFVSSVTLSGGTMSVGSVTLEAGSRLVQSGGALGVTQQLSIGDNCTFTYAGGALSVGAVVIDTDFAMFALSPGGDKLARTRGITTTGTGRMDLADNAATVDYEPGSNPLNSIRSQIISAYNNASWTGGGIGSSLADTTTRGVGYAEASSLTSIPPIFGAVDDTTVLIRLTRYGDADLNGLVNLSDFNRLAGSFGLTSGAVWTQADFNYDGRVNLSDFNLLAANFGLSAAGLGVTPQDWSALAAAVPEPACAAVVFGAAATAALRAARSSSSRGSNCAAKSCRKESSACA